VKTICLDKTGTLTLNQMTARHLFVGEDRLEWRKEGLHSPQGLAALEERPDLFHLLSACILCNETSIEQNDGRLTLYGSATETALIRLAMDAGLDVPAYLRNWSLIQLNHRSESRLFMASLHANGEEDRLLSVKGSPPEVLSMCATCMIGAQVVPLTEPMRVMIEPKMSG
jgi:Ca2+-transporting ATPase